MCHNEYFANCSFKFSLTVASPFVRMFMVPRPGYRLHLKPLPENPSVRGAQLSIVPLFPL